MQVLPQPTRVRSKKKPGERHTSVATNSPPTRPSTSVAVDSVTESTNSGILRPRIRTPRVLERRSEGRPDAGPSVPRSTGRGLRGGDSFRFSHARPLLIQAPFRAVFVRRTHDSTRCGRQLPCVRMAVVSHYLDEGAAGLIRRKPCQSGQSSPSQSMPIARSKSSRFHTSTRYFWPTR